MGKKSWGDMQEIVDKMDHKGAVKAGKEAWVALCKVLNARLRLACLLSFAGMEESYKIWVLKCN